MEKVAKAYIKINKRLEEAGWRFLESLVGSATIRLGPNAKLEEVGDDFEKVKGACQCIREDCENYLFDCEKNHIKKMLSD